MVILAASATCAGAILGAFRFTILQELFQWQAISQLNASTGS